MTALSAMLFASCTSELALEGIPQTGVDGEEVEVTFSVSAMSANSSMRDADGTEGNKVGGPGQWQKYIGRGQNIDMLIYAVYEYNEKENENGSHYTLLRQYGQGAVNEKFESTNNFENSEAYKASSTHAGQTIIDVSETIKQGKSQSITLRLMRNKTYHIAFWAQSSGTAAFDTDDLEKVKVSYSGATNNDELRDAFCKVESFSVSPSSDPRTVILTRPFAQVNVGATGYYNQVKNYIKSKIVLKGVYDMMNVVTDKISKSPESDTKATFDWENTSKFTFNDEKEYLKIDINNNGQIDGFYQDVVPEDADLTTATEVFEYLSMCYVLVPASTSGKEANGVEASSVLDEVDVYLGTSSNTPATSTLAPTFVPVHRNWRTNILIGFERETEPDPDPENPDPDDDPTYTTPKVVVGIESKYEDDYNGREGSGNTWTVIGTSGN